MLKEDLQATAPTIISIITLGYHRGDQLYLARSGGGMQLTDTAEIGAKYVQIQTSLRISKITMPTKAPSEFVLILIVKSKRIAPGIVNSDGIKKKEFFHFV